MGRDLITKKMLEVTKKKYKDVATAFFKQYFEATKSNDIINK